jgi:hypothetical protein
MKNLRTALYCIALSCTVAFSLPLAAEQLDPAPTPEQAKRAAEVEALINARRAAMREEIEAMQAAQEATEQQKAADDRAIQAQTDALRAEMAKDVDRDGERLFADSVSIDRNTALIGAPLEYVDGTSRQGTAYIYVRKGKRWVRQARLIAQDRDNNSLFGSSVAIFGDTALIGADAAGYYRGCAYVFRMKNGQWQQEAKLVAIDGADGDEFGASVALFGDTALVGAWRADIRGIVHQGSVYVFQRTGKSWIFQAKLLASDQTVNGAFGLSVALSGNTALIGAREDLGNGNVHQGAAYVFQRSGKQWVEQAKLVASDAAAEANFGRSVSIDGDFAVIGSPQHRDHKKQHRGAAYVFKRSGNKWAQQAILLASDGAPNDLFGNAVAISGTSVLVGAPLHADTTCAYVFALANKSIGKPFVHDGQQWLQVAKFVAKDAAPGSTVASVSLSGSSALIGAPLYEIGDNTGNGAAYVLISNGKNWLEQAKFTLKDGSK